MPKPDTIDQVAQPDIQPGLRKSTEPVNFTLGIMTRPCGYILMFLLCGSTYAAQADLAESDVMALQKSAEAGDRGAVRKLFNFYPRSDGAVTEDIDMLLGNWLLFLARQEK